MTRFRWIALAVLGAALLGLVPMARRSAAPPADLSVGTSADTSELKKMAQESAAVLKRAESSSHGDERYTRVLLEELSGFDAGWVGHGDKLGKVADLIRAKPIPENVMRHDGKLVAITGFVYPVSFEGESVKDFLLIRTMPGCLFCEMPRINDWVYVVNTRPVSMNQFDGSPVRVHGKLLIAGPRSEELISLYVMESDAIISISNSY